MWRGVDFAKQDIRLEIGPREHAAIARSVDACRHLPLESIQRRHFSNATLDTMMGVIAQQVLRGQGLVVLSGLPVEDHDEADIERMFWGLGQHLGNPVSQSVMGERLGHIVNMADVDPNARGYRHHFELTPHTDFHEVVTFLCVRQGMKGGVSWFVSAHTLHNQLLRMNPELLRTLYKGYYTHRFGEQGAGEAPITEYRVPVFSECEGLVSCRFLRRYIELAAHEGEPLSELEREALVTFDDLSMARENGLFFTLEPGEAVFINNFVVLHGRTAFEDGADTAAKRHLMRLWLTVDDPRPLAWDVAVYASERAGRGIEPQPGKRPSYDDRETVRRVYGNRMPEL